VLPTEVFRAGLDAPICLTWELTYACNLACAHCLSSSGLRRPDELTTAQAKALIDEWAALRVFYVNVGGGEPMLRGDFFEIVEHAVGSRVGVNFSTNGTRLDAAAARRLAVLPYLDLQVSLDGATPETNDALRGPGSYAAALRAMGHLADAEFAGFKLSTVVTRNNVAHLDDFLGLAGRYGARLRVARLRPSGRAGDVWDELRVTAEQQRFLYEWLAAHPEVSTGDSFFHLNPLGAPLPGLNLCGAGRIVCLVDPVGDVYACPFLLDPAFRAGSVLLPGGFTSVWREAPLFAALRRPRSPAGACAACPEVASCGGGCPSAKFFTGLPLDGPDPECVLGHGQATLEAGRCVSARAASPGALREDPGWGRGPR
jgi:mycofactocin biosynthetic radical S-adenosylmethionine protein MftC